MFFDLFSPKRQLAMKTKLLALSLALAAALVPVTSRAETEVSFEFFYNNLSPHGEWVEVGDYGTCWRPNRVDEDWSPYTDGYWTYTDAGWTWVSYEDFGDICYHYGRWVRADEVGWCWVPDYEWGPAWVSWRQTDEHIGWAPLPPEARWRPSVGFSVWVDDHYDIGPDYYNFCPVVSFGAPIIRHVCVPRVSVINIFARTVNITNISFNSYSNSVFCGGPNYTVINQRLVNPIPTLKIVKNTTIINNNYTIIRNKKVVGNTLQVFAPRIVEKSAANGIKPKITKVVAKEKVDKGWKLLQNPTQAKELRAKVKEESKGLTPDTAPAKPVQVADLKPVPTKADINAPSPVTIDRRKGKAKEKGVASLPPGTSGDGRRPEKTPGNADANKLADDMKKAEQLAPSGQAEDPAKVVNQPPAHGASGGSKTDKLSKKEKKELRELAEQREKAEKAQTPNAAPAIPLQKPFDEDRGPVNSPANIVKEKGKNGEAGKMRDLDKDGVADRLERQQAQKEQQEALRQKQLAEKAERDRLETQRMLQQERDASQKAQKKAAQAELKKQLGEQNQNQQRADIEARRRQIEAQKAASDRQERHRASEEAQKAQRLQIQRQQQAEMQQRQLQIQRQQAEVHRQAQMQRQAEARQRQMQVERQQQIQIQRQQQQREAARQMQAQQRQQQMFQQQQPRGGENVPQNGKGKKLSQEELKALQQRGF
jgi:hypothetical protein